jgi:hypothetical protein
MLSNINKILGLGSAAYVEIQFYSSHVICFMKLSQ